MAIALDAEVGAVLMEAAAAAGTAPVAERGDAAALRAITNATLGAVYGQIPAGEAVTRSDFEIEADDGAVIPVRWYVPDERSSDSAVVYAHGGLIAEFSDEASARREAEQWAGICLRR